MSLPSDVARCPGVGDVQARLLQINLQNCLIPSD